MNSSFTVAVILGIAVVVLLALHFWRTRQLTDAYNACQRDCAAKAQAATLNFDNYQAANERYEMLNKTVAALSKQREELLQLVDTAKYETTVESSRCEETARNLIDVKDDLRRHQQTIAENKRTIEKMEANTAELKARAKQARSHVVQMEKEVKRYADQLIALRTKCEDDTAVPLRFWIAGARQAAHYLDMSPSTFNRILRSDLDFPKPFAVILKNNSIWDSRDLLAWKEQHEEA